MIGVIDVGGGLRGSYGAGVLDYCMFYYDVPRGFPECSPRGIDSGLKKEWRTVHLSYVWKSGTSTMSWQSIGLYPVWSM
jgi:hypothetical protein